MPAGAAAGTFAGSVIGAGGQLAGGILGSQGGLNSGDLIYANFDPTLSAALQAVNFDALNQIGAGDPYSTPTPFQELVGRINALPIDERTKRRALRSLGDIQAGNEETRPKRLDQALRRLGLNRDDVAGILDRDAQFRTQQANVASQLSGLNEQTILNRARANATASGLLGSAADFATSGQPRNGFQQSLLDNINRQINDAEEATLIRARFGGFNPGAALEQIQRARQDSNLTAIAQTIQTANQLSQALGYGTGVASQAAGQSTQASLNAAQIAAQQAQAANQLRNQTSLANAQTLGQGIAGAADAFGSGIANTALMSQLFARRETQPLSDGPAVSSNSLYSNSPGSTYGQYGSAVQNVFGPSTSVWGN